MNLGMLCELISLNTYLSLVPNPELVVVAYRRCISKSPEIEREILCTRGYVGCVLVRHKAIQESINCVEVCHI